MKTSTSIVSGLLILLAGCATVKTFQTTDVSAGHIIVPASEQDGVVVTEQEWTPDDKMIAAFETEIGLLFAHPDWRLKGVLSHDGSSPRKAPFPLSDYYIRYCGVSRGGKRLIVGVASHREVADPKFVLRPPMKPIPGMNSRTTEVGSGGGPYFFTSIFDAEKMCLLEVSYNAPL